MRQSNKLLLTLAILLVALMVSAAALADGEQFKFGKDAYDIDLTRNLVGQWGGIAVNVDEKSPISFTANFTDWKDVRWESSDTSIVKVNDSDCKDEWDEEKGDYIYTYYAYLTPYKPGKATISAKIGNTVIGKFDLNLKEVPVTEIKFIEGDADTYTFLKNRSFDDDLRNCITVLPETSTYSAYDYARDYIKWSSSDTSIARVYKDGTLVTRKTGKVTLTATPKDSKVKAATKEITVSSGNPLTAIEFTQAAFKLYKNDSLYLQNYLLTDPSNFDVEDLDWSSSNENVAEVEVGDGDIRIMCHKAGTVTITAASREDEKVKAECTIEILGMPLSSLTLKKTAVELIAGKDTSAKIGFTYKPLDASFENVAFESDDYNVAEVTDWSYRRKSLVVQGYNPGTANITVYNKETGETYATLAVTVKENVVTAAKFSKEAFNLKAGKSLDLMDYLRLTPSDGKWESILFDISDIEVLSVSGSQIYAEGAGEATVTATVRNTDGSQVEASCKVTVTDHKLEKIAFKKSAYTAKLNTKTSVKAYYKVTPVDADYDVDNLLFVSSDEAVAWVEAHKGYCEIHANDLGEADISILNAETGETYATTKIKVEPTAIQKVSLSKSSVKLQYYAKNEYNVYGNGNYAKLNITPSNAYVKSVTWETSDPSVAFVNDTGDITRNRIYATGIGECTITARVDDGAKVHETSMKVTVVSKVPKIKLNATKKTITMLKDVPMEMFQLSAINKDTEEDVDVRWKSSNKKVATVDSNGFVTPVGKGTATITATTKDGNKVKATCKVTIKQAKVTSIKLKKTKLTMKVGDNASLSWTVNPSKAYNKDVTFKSSDKKVVTVDEEGNLTAHKKGTAKITVTAKDGSKKKATCTVTVKK